MFIPSIKNLKRKNHLPRSQAFRVSFALLLSGHGPLEIHLKCINCFVLV